MTLSCTKSKLTFIDIRLQDLSLYRVKFNKEFNPSLYYQSYLIFIKTFTYFTPNLIIQTMSNSGFYGLRC